MEAARKEVRAATEETEKKLQKEITALKENAASKEKQAIEAVLANLY